MRRTSLGPILSLAALVIAWLPPQAHAQAKRVLFIGNSYTQVNDLPGLVRDIALGLGDTLQVTMVAPGGYTFQQHAVYAPTLSAIAQGNWDFVVLQEQSQRPAFPIAQVTADVFPFAAALVDSIAVHAPCAEVLFYMTWGRQNGDTQNCPVWPPVCTFEGMQELLRERYLMMALDNAAWCAPVGVAWRTVRENHPSVGLYAADGSHPSLGGSYLAASVILSTIRRASCSASTFNASLDPALAMLLRDLAGSLVEDSLDAWNIGVRDPVASASLTDLGAGTFQFDAVGAAGLQVEWAFGDGATQAGPSVVHTYLQAGTYQATMLVQDDCGRTDSITIQVEVGPLGMSGKAPSGPRLVPTPEGVRIMNLEVRSRLVLVDPSGRAMLDHDLSPATDQLIPIQWPPLLHWRLLRPDGGQASGTMPRP